MDGNFLGMKASFEIEEIRLDGNYLSSRMASSNDTEEDRYKKSHPYFLSEVRKGNAVIQCLKINDRTFRTSQRIIYSNEIFIIESIELREDVYLLIYDQNKEDVFSIPINLVEKEPIKVIYEFLSECHSYKKSSAYKEIVLVKRGDINFRIEQYCEGAVIEFSCYIDRLNITRTFFQQEWILAWKNKTFDIQAIEEDLIQRIKHEPNRCR